MERIIDTFLNIVKSGIHKEIAPSLVRIVKAIKQRTKLLTFHLLSLLRLSY